jgi:hypothetical protein
MLKNLLKRLKKLFGSKTAAPIDDGKSHPKVMYGDMVGNVKIMAPYQLDKHTDFKPGESYKVGQMVVTVHADKASMLAAIAATNKRREERHARLTERGIELMLMSPEELQKLKIEEWLQKRNEAFDKKYGKRFNPMSKATLAKEPLPQIPEANPPPSSASMVEVVDKVPVKK